MTDRNIQSFGPATPDAASRRREVEIFGHILDVRISAAPGLPHREGAPDHVKIRGLIDTGSSDVCIDVAVAEEAGLRYMYSTTVGAIGDRRPASVYLGVLDIPKIGYRKLLNLYAVKMKRPTHDALIGRIVLADYFVTFEGPRGTFLFIKADEAYELPEHDE
ncbi:MAG: aspartyl protease family protein [Caulobacterales bacterium]